MNATRLFEIPYYQLNNAPQAKAIGHKVGKDWVFWSIQQFLDEANKISLGLLELGVQSGDKIAILSYKNRPEWNVVDIGLQQVGAIGVPVYPTISPREYEYIFNDAGVKYAFVSLDGPGDLLKKVRDAKPNIPTLEEIYTFDKIDDAPYWKDLFREGDLSEVEARKANVKTDDLATLIYTSGTTGDPKGVMLTHKNILSNIERTRPRLPLVAGDKALSFLPLCHVFERAVSYVYMSVGVNIYYTGTDNLGGEGGDLQEIKPHFFTTVPRLLEKVYEKIYNKGLTLTGFKKKLFFWALDLTDDYAYDKPVGGLKGIIADKLIFSKWRAALGGNIKGIVTGAAACPAKMARVFSAAGVPIREGYGLTETSPVLTVSYFEKGGALLGTVGPPLENVTLKLDAEDGDYREGEGEILAKGPNIMQGYYNKPKKTAEVMTADGWFRTGDIGKFVNDNNGVQFLKITGRKKALLKTSGGKYVAPEPIEKRFKEEFLIEQIMIVGENKKFVSALIVPAAKALKDWCDNNDVTCTLHTSPSNPTMLCISKETLQNEKVRAMYGEAIKEINPNFSHIEQIKKFELLSDPWDVTTGEMTPTMKVKRRVIREKFKGAIDGIYNV